MSSLSSSTPRRGHYTDVERMSFLPSPSVPVTWDRSQGSCVCQVVPLPRRVRLPYPRPPRHDSRVLTGTGSTMPVIGRPSLGRPPRVDGVGAFGVRRSWTHPVVDPSATIPVDRRVVCLYVPRTSRGGSGACYRSGGSRSSTRSCVTDVTGPGRGSSRSSSSGYTTRTWSDPRSTGSDTGP